MRRREQNRKEDNEIRPSKGLMALMNRFVALLAWPLRHPVIFVLALVIMFLAPTFMGVKPAEVHLWYFGKIKQTTSSMTDKVISTGKDLMPSVTMPSFEQPQKPTNNLDKVVEPENQQLQRKMFEKAQSSETPLRVDILEQERRNPSVVPQAQPARDVSAEKQAPIADDSYDYEDAPLPTEEELRAQRRRSLDLIYLNNPQEFNGQATVVNANELIIGENAIFLFGIYIDPNTPKGLDAKDFLEDMIGDSPVKCVVEAYTKQGIATGMCFVNSQSINHTMVSRGFSKDVAL